MTKHPFHIVTPSPYPFIASITSIAIVYSFVHWWSNFPLVQLCPLPYLFLLATCFFWWSDVIVESTFQGYHTKRVQSGLRIGISLFIVSEVFFFLGFFWAYLHCSLSPNVELGSCWPPLGVVPLNAFHVPLLNTVVLLSSGATVTWAHSSLNAGSFYNSFLSLGLTVILGVFFTLLQGYEYAYCSYTIADSAYGSCFYMSTGFHGVHVFIGTIFLFLSLIRLSFLHFTTTRHLGFEFACWYWHFVDVIWILLYLIIYIWGA